MRLEIGNGNAKSPQLDGYLNFSEFFKISIDTLLKIDLSKLGEMKIRELESGNDVYIRGGQPACIGDLCR